MKLNLQNIALSAFAAALILSSCSNNGGDGKTGDTTPPETLSVTGVKIKGQSFLMPSPMIIASIIKKSGALYDKNMLNPTASLPNYGDATKAALNLGVYGADLGYITMYENTGDAMEYYKTVVQLGGQLKITGSFDPALMKRFSDNVGNKDSILTLVGEAYRRSDNFLRNGEQDDVATLILAGGWVESLYFALNVYKQKPDHDVAVRIGEQKSTASGVVKVLKDLNDTAKYGQLIRLFSDLNDEYQKVEIKYTFQEPTTDDANHLTNINGNTDVNITPELMTGLMDKVTAIRNYITK